MSPGAAPKTARSVSSSSSPRLNVASVEAIAEALRRSKRPVLLVGHGAKIYHTVEIGGQCWLKENLDVDVLSPQAVAIVRNNADKNTVAKLVLTPTNNAWIAWKPRSRNLAT